MFKNNINKEAKYSLIDISDEFFNLNNWKYKKRKLNLFKGTNNSIVIESKNKGVTYLTLFENNTKFKSITQSEYKILLDTPNIIEISGKKSGNIKAIIYLIEYDENNNRISTNRFRLNDKKIFTAKPNSTYVRIAIRLLGKGEIQIKKFKTSEYGTNKSLLENLNEKKKLKDVRVACIFDEFSMSSFKDIVTLITFSQSNWRTKLESVKPDLLIVESAWKGNSGTWEYQVGKYNNNNNNAKLKELIYWCRDNNIPTIFWNKEDPVHFDKFIQSATLFDYIFTTDSNMIPKYRRYVGHNRVRTMQFAANPKIHNPISINGKNKRISFAGSYYTNRHPDRKKDMDEILSVAKSYGLDIFDRNYDRNKNGNTDFQFPDFLSNNIKGSLKYSEIYKAYKDYRLILNVNSVKYSPTMFSRRVFEGLACGTPIISSYSTGIKKTFYNTVTLLEDRKDFEKSVINLMNNDENYRNLALQGIREVFRKHTYEKRMEFILDILNIEYEKNKHDITIIFLINSMADLQKAKEIVEKQSYENIKILLLTTIFDGYEFLINNYNSMYISTYIIDYAYKYELTEIIKSKYFTIMNLNYTYGENYIEDLVYACIYSDADIIGKKSIYSNENYSYDKYEYQYVSEIDEDTAVFNISGIKGYLLRDIIDHRKETIRRLFGQHGKRIFSSDKFNILK
ncbi:glycosyltransferase [Agaribacter marinus]|uniref:Glycosyltransferase n=1 Tax=Virgibacillus salarius TaxID=447199 RepID=A0A941DUS5_9BACI|nr:MULTISPECIES: glycosyltransferase [Bacillaceae]MBR7797664.1 glycosyltransferase [Virgibacillus salarius]NAZ10374.1 glycosyltransferase [Agaribacter marinus]WBX81934.1 glycosyltransferase [Virgibacillus salarius]